MGIKKKSKNTNLNWKSVQLEGVFDGDDLQGFAGLEVLENYDASLLGGKKRKRNFAISELDGDILSANKKSKKEDDGSGNEEEVKEQTKKKKAPKIKNNSYPGKFVLLKPPEDDDFFANPEHSAVRSVRFKKLKITKILKINQF